jgi:hypothetical protein
VKVAIVSAIYGEYEYPKPIPHELIDIDVVAYMYSDSERVCHEAAENGWFSILDAMEDIATPMLKAKYWKTHPTSAAPFRDASIWLDGSMSITVAPGTFIDNCLNALGDDDISFTPHPLRTCILPEASVTAALARYADCKPIEQVEFYRNVVGHPPNWGLMASGAFTVHHNDNTQKWGELWWDECNNWTYQDQLSLPVITRLMTMEGNLKWNLNMPWAQWWGIAEHGR